MENDELISKLRDISNMRSASHFKRTICKMAAQRLEAQQARIAELEAETKELAKYRTAEKEGRLFVLPCKIGDTVFVNGELRTVACEIMEAYLNDNVGAQFLVSFGCDDDCEGCPFNSWHQDPSGEYSCDGEWCNASIKGSDFGKTVFLTRRGAEMALATDTNVSGNKTEV